MHLQQGMGLIAGLQAMLTSTACQRVSVPYLPHVSSPWVCFCAHCRLLCETQVPQQHSALSSPRGHKGPLVGDGSETVYTTHPCLQTHECNAQAVQTCLSTLLGVLLSKEAH